jgi:hypothetical protein
MQVVFSAAILALTAVLPLLFSCFGRGTDHTTTTKKHLCVALGFGHMGSQACECMQLV